MAISKISANKPKVLQVNGTTGTYGEVATNLSASSYVVVGVYLSRTNTLVTPYVVGNNWALALRNLTSGNPPSSGTAITAYVYYQDR